MGNFTDLHPDLMENIFHRCGGEEIRNLREVCREFRDSLSSLKFLEEHPTSSVLPSAVLILSKMKDTVNMYTERNSRHYSYDLYSFGSFGVFKSPKSYPRLKDMREHPFHRFFCCPLIKRMDLVGGTNGVFCIVIQRDHCRPQELILWNPSTMKCESLPRPKLKLDPEIHTSSSCTGMGFSSRSGYKVVRILDRCDGGMDDIEVLSINRGEWVRRDSSSRLMITERNSFVAMGRPYWRCVKRHPPEHSAEFSTWLSTSGRDFLSCGRDIRPLNLVEKLLWFDVEKELFEEEDFPFEVPSCRLFLGALEDKPCAVIHEQGRNYKIYSFREPVLQNVIAAGFYGSSGILFRAIEKNKGKMFLYDIEDKQIKNLDMYGAYNRDIPFQIFDWVETFYMPKIGQNVHLEEEIRDEPLEDDHVALLKQYGFGPFPRVIDRCVMVTWAMPKKINDLCGIKESDTGLAAPSQLDLVSDKRMMHEEQPLPCLGPYSTRIDDVDNKIKELTKRINDLCGIGESDNGLTAPSQWDIVSDEQMLQEEQPLQVARCMKIISPNTEDAKYVISIEPTAEFVVGLGDKVSPTDIEEGMRVGVDRNKYQIQIPLPPKIDPSVTMMKVEEKPDVTYNDVGGCQEQIEKMREVVELPMLQPEKFVKLGSDPPNGVLCYGPPGTGKTLLARAVANRTGACFVHVIGSELARKYIGEGGAFVVRELFQMARSKKACIVYFDEVDAIGGSMFDYGVHGAMLEIVNQINGFNSSGNIKVVMSTNRPDTLDPALLRPGRIDRKVEFGLPNLESRTVIFKIHTRTMNCERNIRFELLARLCPNSTGADIKSVCTEAGMYAIRARRKKVTEKDLLAAINKVIKGYRKFTTTPKYISYN